MPRRLTPDDADRYRALRREMLLDAPWAFASAPGDDRAESPDWVRQRLGEDDNAIYAVDDADPGAALLACAGIVRSLRLKTPHRADIWGVYTAPRARSRGHARAVVRACLDHARARWPGVELVTLTVSERSPGARRLYESLGFTRWGTEPDALRIGPESAAEHHMHLRL